MPIDKIELTKEQVAKAMACKTAEELMAMAKAEGIELTKEEALHLKRRLRVVPT